MTYSNMMNLINNKLINFYISLIKNKIKQELKTKNLSLMDITKDNIIEDK